jgi:lantibiotic biosynthesis protein
MIRMPMEPVEDVVRRTAAALSVIAERPETEPAGIPPGADAHLGNGLPGVALALLYAGETLTQQRFVDAAQVLLRRAVQSTATRPVASPGLYAGTAGLAWVIAEFAEREPRYSPSRRKLADELAAQILARRMVEVTHGVPFGEFDVIDGSSGQLAALLKVAGEGIGGVVLDAANHLIAHLLSVTDSDENGRPYWLTTPKYYPPVPPWDREEFPHGMYNLGFAHGLPGVIAALSAAARHGLGGPRVLDRIVELTDWLIDHQVADDRGPSWGTAVAASADSRLPDRGLPQPPARAAWCYGAPGIASALLTASAVCDLPDVRKTALASLERVVASSPAERRILSPTLCHGHAGVLTIFQRARTGMPPLRTMCDHTLARIRQAAGTDRLYVFADVPRAGREVDDPGLLTGSAGVLLALVSSLSARSARWTELLLLTPGE